MDAVHVHVALELPLDHLGGKTKRHLAQLRLRRLRGGSVHDFDFFGATDKTQWDRMRGALAGDALDGVLLLFDVLEIQGGDDVDTVCEQFFDVLPALGMLAAGRVVHRQLVDQADLRPTLEDASDIQGVGSQDFQGGDLPGDVTGATRLNGAYDDILAAALAP